MTFAPPTPGIGPWIQSYSGRQIHPLDLKPEQVVLIDVTHALSMAPRFAGHTCRPYCVGEHSIYVAEGVALDLYFHSDRRRSAHADFYIGRVGEIAAALRYEASDLPELGRLAVAVVCKLAALGQDPAPIAWRILRALCHDASEYALIDLPTPIKVRMPDYKDAERSAQAACIETLVPALACDDEDALRRTIKASDSATMLAEKARLLTVDLPDWSPGVPRDRYWACISHAVVGAWPGSLSQIERDAYCLTSEDPHSPRAVESAFYHLCCFLYAVVLGVPVADAVRDSAIEVPL